MIIANGRSKRQVGTMADHLQRKMKDYGLKGVAAEGLANYRNLNVLGHIVKLMTPTSLSDILTRLE